MEMPSYLDINFNRAYCHDVSVTNAVIIIPFDCAVVKTTFHFFMLLISVYLLVTTF